MKHRCGHREQMESKYIAYGADFGKNKDECKVEWKPEAGNRDRGKLFRI